MTSNKIRVRWIYKAVLRADGVMIDVRDIIDMYQNYSSFRKEIQDSPIAPGSLKACLAPVNMPKYLEWIKKFAIERKT